MIGLSLGLLFAYAGLILRLTMAWKKLDSLQIKESRVFVTVIVPVRNEETHIQGTIQSILTNDFPTDQLEVIVVNDHSNDGTVQNVLELQSNSIRIENLPEGRSGKKAAITHAVNLAKGDLIICTDGDTVVPENWINLHASACAQGSKMTFGSVQYEGSGFVNQLLNLELMSLVGVGGATLSLGYPSMINGCNYSFSKKVFIEVGGFLDNVQLATGDDEFLLRKIHNKYPGKVKFIENPNSSVLTQSILSLREFYHQRKRWASKWKHHRDLMSKILPFLVFSFYLLFYGLLFFLTLDHVEWAFVLLLAKWMVDLIFVQSIAKSLGLKTKVLPFMALQIIYPFYAVFFGLASNFGQYRWKERNHDI